MILIFAKIVYYQLTTENYVRISVQLIFYEIIINDYIYYLLFNDT